MTKRKAEGPGREEAVVEDQTVSGCMAYAAPVVVLVAGYFVKSSWGALSGAEPPIIDDSGFLNLVAGLAITGVGLFFAICGVLVLIGFLWKTKMKFYERGVTLHGVGALEANGQSTLFYDELDYVRIGEKHNLNDASSKLDGKRLLHDMTFGALAGKKPAEQARDYENTEYTFSFKLKKTEEPVKFTIALDRADGEVAAIIERLSAEGIRVERKEAQEKK